MALPKYDKSKRKKSFPALPKAAYVIRIMNAKEQENKNSAGSHIAMAFDIAEGEYKDYFKKQYDSSEDKKWPNDGTFRLTVPADGCQQYIWDNWNSFFADLEDSNNGFIFAGDPKALKGKLIGGKFYIEQSSFNGQIYDHTRLKWTCVADDVRNGKAGRLPNDKLISSGGRPAPTTDKDGFMKVADSDEDEVPFD